MSDGLKFRENLGWARISWSATPSRAEKTQLEKLLEGVDSWNLWRKKNPEVEINLHRAKLDGAILDGIDLNNADLDGIYLNDASLRHANLEGASLRPDEIHVQAHLERVDFTGANLKGANLINAEIDNAIFASACLEGACLAEPSGWGEGAIFSSANLRNAIFEGLLDNIKFDFADLSGARFYDVEFDAVDLNSAVMNGTYFLDCDLSNAISLDTCVIKGVCFVDDETIAKSKCLPKSFLERCEIIESVSRRQFWNDVRSS